MIEPLGIVQKVQTEPRLAVLWLSRCGDLFVEHEWEWVETEKGVYYFDSYSLACEAAAKISAAGLIQGMKNLVERTDTPGKPLTGVHAVLVPARGESAEKAGERHRRNVERGQRILERMKLD